jgi:hypothetical protein
MNASIKRNTKYNPYKISNWGIPKMAKSKLTSKPMINTAGNQYVILAVFGYFLFKSGLAVPKPKVCLKNCERVLLRL